MQLQLKDFQTEPPAIVIPCFSILESVIVLMANQEEVEHGTKMIDEETLLQLHTTLMESLSFIVKSLKTHEDQVSGELSGSMNLYPGYLTAAVRLLGAWLAEDSLSLSDEIFSIIPFLLRLCDSVQDDVLKFLLPGFSNLVTDVEPRRILVENGLPSVLLKHVHCHMKRYQASLCCCK